MKKVKHPGGPSFISRWAPAVGVTDGPKKSQHLPPPGAAGGQFGVDSGVARFREVKKADAFASVDAISAAPEAQRAELLARRQRLFAIKAGTTLGANSSGRPQPFERNAGGWRVTVGAEEIRLQNATATLSLREGAAPAIQGKLGDGLLPFLLKGFEALLPSDEGIDRGTAQLYLHLFGSGGRFGGPTLADGSGFVNPKVLAYDLNGTAEGRSGLGPTTGDLNHMGSVSLITTTVNAESGERAMRGQGAPFNSFHGGGEVRPGGGNKVYREVAKAYGLDPAAMRAQMVVIGDSATDAPGDVSGVVFVHNNYRTPAEALLLLLASLDRLGEGNFGRGAQRLLDRGPRAQLGPLQLRVETRQIGEHQVPTIADLSVSYSTEKLAQALVAKPAPNDPVGQAAARLAAGHFSAMSDQQLSEVATGLIEAGAGAAVRAAILTRVDRRRVEVAAARDKATKLWREAEDAGSELLSQAHRELSKVGDAQVTELLTSAIDRHLDAQARRLPERTLRAQAFVDQALPLLEQLVARAEAHGELDLTRGEARLLSDLARGLPSQKSDRERVLDGLRDLVVKGGGEEGSATVSQRELNELKERLVDHVAALGRELQGQRQLFEGLKAEGLVALRAQEQLWSALGQALQGGAA